MLRGSEFNDDRILTQIVFGGCLNNQEYKEQGKCASESEIQEKIESLEVKSYGFYNIISLKNKTDRNTILFPKLFYQ